MKAFTAGFFSLFLIATAGYAGSETMGPMEHMGHAYIMKGQIIDVSADGVYLCIGSSDGAKAGDEFKVYKINKTITNEKNAYPAFRKVEVGTVKIDKVVDEHFAKATVLTGKAEINSVVELDNKNHP